MHIDRYEYNENDKGHRQFLKHYNRLCSKYNIFPIPKIVFYGVEDAVVAVYRLDSGVELNWGCQWCESANEAQIVSYYINKDHYIQQEQKRREEHQKYLNSLSTEYIKTKINELENNISEIKLKQTIKKENANKNNTNNDFDNFINTLSICNNTMSSPEEVGSVLKVLSMRLQSVELQDVLKNK